MEYIERNSKLLVSRAYDVIVIGGGMAGVAAAISASQNGAKTLILEKSIMFGGLATTGHIAIYLPICDGLGRKVASGLAEEFLLASIKYGYSDLPEEWLCKNESSNLKSRYQTIFNVPAFAIALDEMVMDAKVDVLFDTVFSEPVIEDGFIKAIIVENKSGRQAFKCKVAIDATGDADLMYRAGVTCMKALNHMSYWGCMTSIETMEMAVESKNIMHGINIMTLGADSHGIDNTGKASAEKYDGTDADQVTQFVMNGRKMALNAITSKNKSEFCIAALPSMAQFRTTRRIKGIYELISADGNKRFEDSIGCIGDWSKPGPVYEIPYRTLISNECKNIIAAGRIISSEGDAWEITRVIPAVVLTGQAAGTAGAMAALEGKLVTNIDIVRLQNILINAGVKIHV